LRTPYTSVVAYVGQLLGRLPRSTDLVIDYTGVSHAVADLFTYSGIVPVGVSITGGGRVIWESANTVSVPKITLISRLTALLHQGALKVHKDLPEGSGLAEELRNFKMSHTEGGNLQFSARQGRHDDLILSASIAAWYLADSGRPSQGVYRLLRRARGGPARRRRAVRRGRGSGSVERPDRNMRDEQGWIAGQGR
jgi:hypothetical protein